MRCPALGIEAARDTSDGAQLPPDINGGPVLTRRSALWTGIAA
jgi:hypothetical protein